MNQFTVSLPVLDTGTKPFKWFSSKHFPIDLTEFGACEFQIDVLIFGSTLREATILSNFLKNCSKFLNISPG